MFKINSKIQHKKIWFDSMVGMTIGFFATLIIGTIIGLFGKIPGAEFMISIKKVLSYSVGIGIGVGVGVKCGLNPLQIFAVGFAAMIASISMLVPHYNGGTEKIMTSGAKIGFFTDGHLRLGIPGDVFGAWLVSVLLVYLFKIFEFKTYFDIFLVPIIGIFIGILSAFSIIFLTTGVVSVAELGVDKLAKSSRTLEVLLAPIIGLIMGLALSLPTSSAAIAIMIRLHGAPASAAMAATAAQMISFGVLTWMANKKVGKTIAVGFGTSMLHMKNYMRSPRVLIIPTICSMVAAMCATGLTLEFPVGKIGVPTSGMGTSALYGPIFTLFENGWSNYLAWLHIIVMQLAIPTILTIALWYLFRRFNWITKEELQLEYV
ncbi:PTS sugar transporter subunit IIC [Mycoplasma marinum]|uniref:Phosphotransferase system EIIC domain-containing protein n=1 Tax=Mycoplasma marinum TaxID=1937190 RepID=A0A4R0XJI1_9MOLU|nr:PTS sugar transporter subunit IIC [Mycoplasma marinum]TCG10796.1 hypothetical protein C4B24_03935 [Mycoplasma marinum]